MPSTLVHLAIGGLIAVSLLREEFGWRTVVVVLIFSALPDLDAFIGLIVPGAHRSLLHSLFFPLGLHGIVLLEERHDVLRIDSAFDGNGIRVMSIAILAVTIGGIAPDLVTNGVNLLYPVQDTFVRVTGEMFVSSTRGFVQTFVEFGAPDAGGAVVGSTQTIHYATGVDPTPGQTPDQVERLFPIIDSGMQLLLVALSATLLTIRGLNTKR
jgi:hypothetical protein